jgi:sulfoxide reductase heme-binding subunit YedZ
MPDILILWRDRRGRLSWLRVATLAMLLFPLALMTFDWARGALGGRPLNEVIHRTGWWALVFLLASLAVTPLRRSGHFTGLFDVRRMIGVGCFCYAALHILLYVVDLKLDLVKVAVEIVSRLYLTIGFVALIGLAALAVTSNDTMVKRLGGLRWRRLHQATYVVTLLALIHFFQQTKADVTVPTLYAGLFLWLIAYRLLAAWRGDGGLTPLWLAGLAVVTAALVFLGEGIGLAIAFKQPVAALLPQYFATVTDLDLGFRPGWSVLIAGLVVAALELWRGSKPAPVIAAARPVSR